MLILGRHLIDIETMLFRYNYSTPVTVKRNTYTGDKSSYVEQSPTVMGYFSPTATNETIGAQGIISQSFQFVTDGTQDIQANDRLVIGSTEYGVKGIQRFTQLSQDVLVCTLNKSVNK
jgi:hypothetical protein